MNVILEQIKKPIFLVGIAGFLVGAIFGLLVLGWGVWPVEYAPSEGYAVDYLSMAIDSYTKNQDGGLAQARWSQLGSSGEAALLELKAHPGVGRPTIAEIDAFAAAANISGQMTTPLPTVEGGTPEPKANETPQPVEEGGFFSLRTILIGLGCVVVIAVVAGLIAYIFLRKRPAGSGSGNSLFGGGAAKTSVPEEDDGYSMQSPESPAGQFMTTFSLGDDLYDDSFSIDSPSGEFLGECGVGISETIGVGDPKKPAAFEVWLFDKNDIQTVTSVLMSSHAYNDPATRQKLELKGEPVLTQPGQQIVLETATLQLVARVVDLNYGQGALPANSFFNRLSLELSVWQKAKPTQ